MSEQSWWTRDSKGNEHPDDAALLAFVREKLSSKDKQEVYNHLSECARCQDHCRVGRLLYKAEPEYEESASVAEQVFAYINNPADAWFAKQRKRLHQLSGDIQLGLALVRYWTARAARAFLSAFKSKEAGTTTRRSVNKVPLKWAFALFALAIVAAILLALSPISSLAQVGLAPHKKIPPVVSHHTATPTPRPTPTQMPTPTPTRAPTAPVATLHLCGTMSGSFQERVGICGYHFHAGDKLELVIYVAGSVPRPFRVLTVNAQGQFQTFLLVTQCRETIKALYAKDLTNSSVHSDPLSDFQVGRCVVSHAG